MLHFVLEAFTLLKHLCLCLCLSPFQVLDEVLQAFELSACPMSGEYNSIIKNLAIAMWNTDLVICSRDPHSVDPCVNFK